MSCARSPSAGSNVTGLSNQQADLAGKRLELLLATTGGLRRVAIIANVGNPAAALEVGEVPVRNPCHLDRIHRARATLARRCQPRSRALTGATLRIGPSLGEGSDRARCLHAVPALSSHYQGCWSASELKLRCKSWNSRPSACSMIVKMKAPGPLANSGEPQEPRTDQPPSPRYAQEHWSEYLDAAPYLVPANPPDKAPLHKA